MNKYTIYCTEEQAKKAIELGAPILADPQELKFTGLNELPFDVDRVVIPTAEQMIGWLEEQGLYISVTYTGVYNWKFSKTEFIDGSFEVYDSRKETTLAAIDVALDYLIKTKEEYIWLYQ